MSRNLDVAPEAAAPSTRKWKDSGTIDSSSCPRGDGNHPEKKSKKALKRMARIAHSKKRRKERRMEYNRNKKYKMFEFDDPVNVRYTIHAGMRHANPYFFDYKAVAKGRWFGRELYEVYASEFLAYSKIYYEKAILSGRITVNKKQVSPSHLLKNGDRICHSVHRHEPPVVSGEIGTHFEDENVVIVSKPGSIPMHPCGKYRHNSLIYILGKQLGGVGLYMVHRLDRLTSGLVVLTKSSNQAAQLAEQIRSHSVQKTYLARVLGKFPSTGSAVSRESESSGSSKSSGNSAISSDNNSNKNRIIVKAPIICVDKRIGRQVCGEAAIAHAKKIEKSRKDKGEVELKHAKWEQPLKQAETEFELLRYDGHTSLVKCMPKTGRTHQIRVHLEWLGYPIANDPCYGGSLYESNSFPPYGGLASSLDLNNNCKDSQIIPPELKNLILDGRDPKGLCEECKAGSYWTNSKRHCSHIWLHALSYKGKDWTYTVPPPAWAEEGFDSRAACQNALPHDPYALFKD